MGKASDNRAAALMAAVSVIALSVGMVSAQAEDSKGVTIQQKTGGSDQKKADTHYMKYESSQLKGDSSQQKGSNQIKGDSHYLKYESSQMKGGSSQLKLDSQQIKGATTQNGNSVQNKKNSVGFNPQPDPPGDISVQHKGNSVQQKGSSVQQKVNAGSLNPQPEPPG